MRLLSKDRYRDGLDTT